MNYYLSKPGFYQISSKRQGLSSGRQMGRCINLGGNLINFVDDIKWNSNEDLSGDFNEEVWSADVV